MGGGSGDLNITVEGDCRLLTMGSMVQEVRGNYHLNVLGDMRVKVGGNLTEEIMSARKVKVEKDDDLKVGKSQVVNIGVSSGHHCGKNCAITAGSVFSTNSGGGSSLVAGTDMFLEGKIAIDISGGAIAGLGAPITNITGTVLVNITAPVGVINVLAPLINIIAVAVSYTHLTLPTKRIV